MVYFLFSCNSNAAKKSSITANNNNAKELDTSRAVIEAHSADSVFSSYPIDTIYPARILTAEEAFHEDEVDKRDRGRSWYGLFMNKEGYYLDSTRIITKRVEDPTGEDGNLNGWEVKTSNSDTSMLLISGVDGLSKRKIVPVNIDRLEMFPGKSTTFSYNGITYTLYATGNKGPGGDNYIVTSYRLFIKATINGMQRQQLLVAEPAFNDAITTILFAGDIDGDGFPDFIIDTISHYNGARPTLYLSKPAGGTQLLKVMGWHVSLGC
jgi:hypothetical protein